MTLSDCHNDSSRSTVPRRERVRCLSKWILIITLIIFTLFIGFMIWLRFYHPAFIYNPEVLRELKVADVAALMPKGCTPKNIPIASADGTKLNAYWLEHPETLNLKGNEKLPVLLYLHGNRGELRDNMNAAMSWQRNMAINVLIVSYRGYGLSEGAPSMDGIRMDSQAALDYLYNRSDVDRNKIVLYGHSLGGAVALHLFAANISKFQAVLIENTFTSVPKMASHSKPALQPFAFLVTEIWDNEEQVRAIKEIAKIDKIKFPHIMLITGEKDTVVPPAHMNVLWEEVKGIEKVRSDVVIMRNHLRECNHTCYPIKGYFTKIIRFLQDIPELKPLHLLNPPLLSVGSN